MRTTIDVWTDRRHQTTLADVPDPGDAAVGTWFLSDDERRNPASDIRGFTSGNLVEPLVDGGSYFALLYQSLCRTGGHDQVYFTDFRGDTEERLAGPGTSVGEVFSELAERGVLVFGLIWRSQPSWLDQSEGKNAELARALSDAGGEVLLDSRTRRAGSHHQKLVVIRYVGRPELDIAFVGGIDLGRSRNDDSRHAGDPQAMEFPSGYGERPPWHDVQASVRGPAVADIEQTFRERWYGSTVLDLSSPMRMLIDRAYHAGKLVGRDLPETRPEPGSAGPHAVQVLRTYPARLRRYPFAPLGERSIAYAYRKAFARARRLIYIEDQYLWAPFVATLLAAALRGNPELRVIAVVPRYPDKEGRSRWPSLVGREQAIKVCSTAGGDRFAIYDLENVSGTPVYVHAKVVVVDDVWAMIGSDNLNRRSWTHDSELSCAVLDETLDEREPRDPAGHGDGARRFARELRLQLWHEHLDLDAGGASVDEIVDPHAGFDLMRARAEGLQRWYDGGHDGPRPPGRLRPHSPERLPRRHRPWAVPVYRVLYDPDGRAIRDRLRRRP
jgi:phosphatidylserine/phosphatidylglycerophosphate/cardiolipin synthase-like enzyme